MAGKADNGKAFLTRDGGRKPPSPGVHVAGVPQELRLLARWVCWRWSWKDDGKGAGKWDKPPVMALRKGHASSNDPATWASFEDALSAYQRSTGGLDGVGFVLSRPYEAMKGGKTIRHDLPDDGLVGIDLDDAVDPKTDTLKPWAAAIVEALGTYTERSPTGTGVKLILRGRLPQWWTKRKVNWHDGEIETYDHGRYFTVTGLRLDGSPATVEERQARLDEVLQEVKEHLDLTEDLNRFGGDSYQAAHPPFTLKMRKPLPSCSDEELLDQALKSKQGPALRALLGGDASAYEGDTSRADEALCAILAFWCGPPAAGGPSRVDRLFRTSQLMRGKWDEPHRGDGATYGRMTIEKAYHGRTAYHTDYDLPGAGKAAGKRTRQQRQQDQKSQADGATLAVTCLNTIKPRPLRWKAPRYFPRGKLILVAGEGGKGKSTLTLSVAADVTRGRACLGLVYESGDAEDVLLVSCEDGMADTVVPRLLAAGADLSRCHHVDGIKDKDGKLLPFSLAHFEVLERYLQANPEVGLVVIDPAGAFIGRAGVDDHKDSELRSLLDPLAELADRHDVLIVLVKHLNKNAGAKAVDRVGGSAGYVNAVRAAFMVLEDDEDDGRRLFLPIKFNLGPKPPALAFRPSGLGAVEAERVLAACDAEDAGERQALGEQLFHVAWEGAVSVTADEVMRRQAQGQRGGKKQDALDWLRAHLQGGPKLSDEVYREGEKAGFSRRTLFRAREGVKEEIRASKQAAGWAWGYGDPKGWPTLSASTEGAAGE